VLYQFGAMPKSKTDVSLFQLGGRIFYQSHSSLGVKFFPIFPGFIVPAGKIFLDPEKGQASCPFSIPSVQSRNLAEFDIVLAGN
jgi:hypothetical protein